MPSDLTVTRKIADVYLNVQLYIYIYLHILLI